MSEEELYTKGAKVWIPDSRDVWSQATVVKWTHRDEDTRELLVALQDGTEVSLVICDSRDVPALVNPDILLGENDLTKLSYLHEPAVLHNLRTRFTDLRQIYTYCGIVLVAINPYQDVPIYSKDMMSAYHKLNTSEADPHVFAIGEEALRRMTRKGSNQSIIVSGESGAGKTVSAKYILRYFAFISGSDGDAQIEKKVLASNPVMESIGNAKTTRNDNSSRFGKYLQIQFNKTQTIIGASLRTYLLEKTRVVSHAVSERNYHIFYQLCSAYVNRKKCESASLDVLNLGPSSEFHYLNQGQSVRIGGTDDYKDFFTTSEALGMVGISTNLKKEVFAVLAAILHLGNVEIIENDRESCDIDSHDCHLTMVSALLGINQSDLHKWLCNKSIVMETESIVTPLTQTQSLAVRDGLAKHLYAQLFDWIVAAVNGKLSAGSDPASFIGVLDIYGFEIFGVNSFEQFCINYANEKLQQQFNMHVFKLEQEEYIKEGIDWSVISFHDNQPCIDLIEGKCGILDLIDETCKLPRGGDDMLIQKFYHSHLRKQGELGVDHFFGKPRTSTDQFVIYHFADKVTYDVWGFVEKNMDRLIPEHLSMLKNSSNPFVCELFKTLQLNTASGTKQKRGFLGRKQGGAGGGVKAVRAGRSSVGSQFKESLGQLMSTLSSTAPHYIRCIKPNDVKEAFKFDPHRAVQQLRACGVLETIKISAMGYPSRWNYDEFFNRYRLLLTWGQVRPGETKAMSIRILNMCISEDKYCFGKSKIFFRAGQVAYLEKLRSDKLHNSSVMIQKHVKRWIQQRKYLQFRSTIVVLQSCVRGYLTRKTVEALRKTRASVVIQKWFRCHRARQHYKKLRDSICLLQRRIRGTLARRKYKEALLCKKATVIQRAVKGWLARKKYRESLRKIVKVQCCVRRWLAVRALKKLKLKARSVEHIKQLNKGLENKIIELQQKLIQKEKLEDLLQSTKLEALSWRRRAVESERALKETTEELRMNNEVVNQLTGELKSLRSELAEERQSRLHERERFEEEIRFLREKVVELESVNRDDAGIRTNQDRSTEEETSLTSPTDLGDEDGYYSSRHSEIEVGDLQHEIQELKQKHQKLINEYISLQSNRQKGSSEEGVSFRTETPTSPILIDALQSEVTRLTGENLTLREQVEDTTALHKTRRSIRGFKNGPTSEKEDSKFLGMFSYRPEDLFSILHHLILDVKPGQVDTFGGIPCFPAHIIFMCIRYVDHCNNEDLMEELMEGVIGNIQQVTRKHAKDLDFLSFWLANTSRLCHNIAQFSGHGVRASSPRMAQIQKEFGLCNFDLAEFKHLLEQKATALYLEVARSIILRTEPLVVPALLEHNPLPGMPNIPTTPHPNVEDTSDDATLESFIDRLSEVLSILQTNCVDPLLINQLMSHVFQMINAHMLNSLLLRKDICHWTKGIQINYTISQLEDWCHEGNLGSQVVDQLQPVKEATKLLQLRKTTKKDADAVVDLCTHLTSLQVQKLLTMYTPGDFEGKVPTSLVRLIGERCCKRDGTSGRELLVHIEDSPRTTLPHTVTDLNYKKISLPLHLKLDKLLIKI